jgi:hypothetical protein
MNGTKHLNLQHDAVLPCFAFNLNLRPCSEALADALTCPIAGKLFVDPVTSPCGRGLHSSTFQLNLSRF